MVLDKLHIPQGNTLAVSQRHTVAGDDAAVGIKAIGSACATRGDNDRLGQQSGETTIGNIERQHPLANPIGND